MIIYVTGRPDMQKHRVVAWLTQHNFPHGIVSFCDGLTHDPLRQKAVFLQGLQQEVGDGSPAAPPPPPLPRLLLQGGFWPLGGMYVDEADTAGQERGNPRGIFDFFITGRSQDCGWLWIHQGYLCLQHLRPPSISNLHCGQSCEKTAESVPGAGIPSGSVLAWWAQDRWGGRSSRRGLLQA